MKEQSAIAVETTIAMADQTAKDTSEYVASKVEELKQRAEEMKDCSTVREELK